MARSSPSQAGIDADRVMDFLDDVERAGLELHSLMLHRHGHVAVEGWRWPYTAERPRVLHSTTKSFTACAIGLAIDEGRFGLSDKVLSFFPGELPPDVSENLAAMTVEDLLTMRTGQASETSGSLWRSIESSWIAEFFKIPVVHPPGSTFVYTSAASYMLSAILSRVTGQTLHAYLKPRLFEPLGIEGESWDMGPDGINPGGNGLTARTVDMLKLGILHAQDGMWEGKRVLPESWVREATRPQGRDGGDGSSKYGYHWVIRPQHAFSAIGVFMQTVIVYREHGATLAVTGAIENSGVLFPHVERHFPMAFGREAGAAADARLHERLVQWKQPCAAGPSTSVLQQRISGTTFAMQSNAAGVTQVRLDFAGDRCEFRLFDAEGEHRVTAGMGCWIEGRTNVPGRDLHHGYRLRDAVVIASTRWVDERTLEMEWIFVETAFRDTVTCVFEGDGITVKRAVNINSGLRRHPDLTGTCSGAN